MLPKLSDTMLMGLIVVLLTGCVASSPRPVSVEVSRAAIDVRLSDGSHCSGLAPADGAGTWSGRLGGCSASYAYTVQGEANPNPLRQGVEVVLQEIGAGDALYPMADVTITGPEGQRWIFASPPPLD